MRDDFASFGIAVRANGRVEQRVACPRCARGEIAISGELTVETYTDKNGVARPSLDLLAHTVLTGCNVQRKREAVPSVMRRRARDLGAINVVT